MKKILLLTTCLLGGLVAADPQYAENSRGTCYTLANNFNEAAAQIAKLTKDIQVHARIAFDCQCNAELNSFYRGRNDSHMEARGKKIEMLTVELSKLEHENSKLLDAIMKHPHFSTMTIRGYLKYSIFNAVFGKNDSKQR